MDTQDQTDPPQPEIAGPAEAVTYLTEQLRSGMDSRHRIAAAQGVVNYHLAAEIAGLIDTLVQQTQSLAGMINSVPTPNASRPNTTGVTKQ